MARRRIKGHTYISHEKKERNQEIYLFWLKNKDEMSLADIGKRYGLHRSRIFFIVKREKELAEAGR
jgi:Mor family transcriptional regulator